MVELELNQEILRGGQKMPHLLLLEVAKAVSRHLGFKRTRKISVAFVSESVMKKLNKQYRGVEGVTDVLSFELGEGENFGEIILCYAQAKRQAKQMKHSVRDEITFLLVHGILHVFGHDHEIEREAKKMFPLQSKILESLGVNPII